MDVLYLSAELTEIQHEIKSSSKKKNILFKKGILTGEKMLSVWRDGSFGV